MIRGALKIGGAITSIIASILLIIFGESWLIASTLYIGPTITFFIFFPISFTMCFGVFYIYHFQRKSENKIIIKIEGWIQNKEKKINRITLKLIKISKGFGLLFSTLIVGPLPTTIIIGLLGYKWKNGILLIAIFNLIFLLVWIGIYSGAIKILSIE
ncbi:hypothetical protein KKF61_01415 [Patescibacteria group bacterium]|nr:hypothetical protein [Patescibacteria group bacterium]MBU0963883.1 hypothetical protein [Patescibacteria group bacterium]